MLERLKKRTFLTTYNSKIFTSDLLAGITLFVMLIPQGMAYAMLAGIPPVMGLYAATIPLFIYAIFASSKHLSVGPVAISSLLVFSGVSALAEPNSISYVSYVLILAAMVGAIQLLLGISRLGFIVKFIPHSVMNGYTSAAAIVIGVSQIKHVLGIEVGNYLQIHYLLFDVIQELKNVNLLTVLIGLASMSLLIIFKKIGPRMPGALIIVIVSSALVYLFSLEDKGVQIVGDVPTGLPAFILPDFTIETIKLLVPMAVTIALMGFMESLAIAKTIARKEKYLIYPNKELKAIGLSNLIGAFFQSMPINGSFSRTAVNHQSGGATQVTSVITGILVIVTLLFFTSYFYYLPNAVLAAIILVAVYSLVDIKELKHLFNINRFEGLVWITTFIVTLFVGIQWGIVIGAIFTLILLLKKSAQPSIVELGYVKEEKTYHNIERYPDAVTSDQALIIRIDSSLHFANISFIEEKLKNLLMNRRNTKWVIINMAGVNDVDTISVDTLEEMIDHYQRQGITILFSNMKGSIRDTINKVHWNKKYQEQMNHLPLEQLLKEKEINIDSSKQLEPGVLDYHI